MLGEKTTVKKMMYSDDETDSNSGDTNENINSVSEVEHGFKVNGDNYYEDEEEA